MFILWMACQAVGGVVLGYISDRKCRRKVLLFVQAVTLLIFVAFTFKSDSIVLLTAMALLYNPISPSRAAIVDNFTNYSRVKLIALTVVAEFAPWIFYDQFIKFNDIAFSSFIIILMSVNFILIWFLFDDKRDLIKNPHQSMQFHDMIKIKHKMRFYLTVLAFFPAQLVFYFTDTLLEKSPQNFKLFSALGLGSVIGTVLANVYRKIPHISLLTITYGLAFLLSSTPLLSLYLYKVHTIDPLHQILIIGCLGGFYIPFVYDVALGAVNPNFRGTSCGIIEGIYSICSIVSLLFIDVFSFGVLFVLTIIPILFLVSMVVQRRAE